MNDSGSAHGLSSTEKSLEHLFSYFFNFARDSEGLSELMVNPDG